MSEEWIGLVVSGKQISGVHLKIESDAAALVNHFSWKLQSGDEVLAYSAIFERIKDYIKNHSIDQAVIKASAVGSNRPTLAHLKSAELRGLICVAANLGGATTSLLQKSLISRTFGSRKVDDYIGDDSFWKEKIKGILPKGKREAALLILSQID